MTANEIDRMQRAACSSILCRVLSLVAQGCVCKPHMQVPYMVPLGCSYWRIPTPLRSGAKRRTAEGHGIKQCASAACENQMFCLASMGTAASPMSGKPRQYILYASGHLSRPDFSG